jgi:hypothetical protein
LLTTELDGDVIKNGEVKEGLAMCEVAVLAWNS